ncbi:MAG: ATP-binding protein [Lentimicrobiaceae bacterium]|nr:ATP-binding protein [Lentimicrobiaceae bacterium]
MIFKWFEHEDREQELNKNLQFDWLEHLPFPAILTDKYGNIIALNPSFSAISGFTSDNLPDKNIGAIINPDLIIPVESLYGSDHGVCKLLCENGKLINCNISRKTFNTGSQITLKLNVITPLNQLWARKADIASAHSEDEKLAIKPYQTLPNEESRTQTELKAILKQTSTATWEVSYDSGQTVTKVSNFFELLNLSIPQVTLTPEMLDHAALVYDNDLPVYQLIHKQIKSGSPSFCAIDYRIHDVNGKIHHFHAESKLITDEDGKIRVWHGSIQDRTREKQAAILQESAFKIARFVHPEQNIDGLTEALKNILNSLMPVPEFSLVLINEKSELSYIYPPQSINAELNNSLPFYVIQTQQPLLASRDDIERLINDGIISPHKNIPFSYLGMPLIAGDKSIGAISLQSFSPKLIYTENESNLLHFISLQASLAIQYIRNEKTLLHSKKEAEDSSRLKSSLLANMSHELRTPMTGILGFSEILSEELDDPRMKSMASTIFKSAGRLMSTLNSIIDLSAVEVDKSSLDMKPLNTRQLFQPLLRAAHSMASDKGLYLRTAIPPEQYVFADEKMLSQLLYHLLDNAIKFTIDGGISVSVYKPSKTSHEIVIRISDTGIGIAPEHHSLIFEEFRQVSEGFSRNFEGSGLGLSLCTKIAHLIDARLWVESIQDRGSDFFVALPLIEHVPDIKELDEKTARVIRTHRLSRGPVPEVLIVEDNEINRRLAALYLRELCNTEMAENGYVALEKINRKKYDAILMDINLGAGPNGLAIAAEAKISGPNKNTPIIAVTGYTMHGDKEKMLNNGCSHYIPKPYDKKTLLKLFSKILYA